jgi:signal transduction histidine kinase
MHKVRAARTLYDVVRLAGLALLIGLVAAGEVWRSYHQATTNAERSVAGLVALLAEQTERTIQAVDFTLIGMRDALQVAANLQPDDSAYRSAMLHRLKRLPYVRALFVVGPDGSIVHDTDYPETPRINLADRPYFLIHQLDSSAGLHIGQPLRSRSVDAWFVSFSRRINNADGSFGGIVVAAVEPRYFEQIYQKLSLRDDDLVALLLRDGTLLARTPDHDKTIGRTYADSPLRLLAVTYGRGVAWSTSPIDGVTRIIGYRVVAKEAAIVLYGWSMTTIYDAWIEHNIVLGAGSVLVWLLASGLTLLWLKSRRQERMEQARLGQVQRLEMMGRIVGGIAHDLGNTVKIARTTFSLLKPSLTSQHGALALVDDADRSLKSAFDIIDRLLAFARRQELNPRATELGELISGFAPILRQAAGPHIELKLNVAGRLVSRIDPIHLESALLNLVLNSKDAMPHGGCIVIEVREAQAPSDRRIRHARPTVAPPWAEIVVRDDGVGMSRDVQERAFEPFFTTRTGGSGLGLSQVLGFAQQSAGEVRIVSTEGVGTSVSLLFPTTFDPPGASPSSSSADRVGSA